LQVAAALMAGLVCVCGQGLKISQYPSTNTLGGSERVLLAVGGTNMTITAAALAGWTTNGLASRDYVDTAVGGVSAHSVKVDGTVVGARNEFTNLTLVAGTNVHLAGTLTDGDVRVQVNTQPTQTLQQITYALGSSNVHAGAASNLVVNFDLGSMRVFATNDLTLTNFAGLEAGEGTGDRNLTVHLIPAGGNRTVAYPTAGAASYGVRVWMVGGCSLWTTLTNGVRYKLILSAQGTNIDAVMAALQ